MKYPRISIPTNNQTIAPYIMILVVISCLLIVLISIFPLVKFPLILFTFCVIFSSPLFWWSRFKIISLASTSASDPIFIASWSLLFCCWTFWYSPFNKNRWCSLFTSRFIISPHSSFFIHIKFDLVLHFGDFDLRFVQIQSVLFEFLLISRFGGRVHWNKFQFHLFKEFFRLSKLFLGLLNSSGLAFLCAELKHLRLVADIVDERGKFLLHHANHFHIYKFDITFSKGNSGLFI